MTELRRAPLPRILGVTSIILIVISIPLAFLEFIYSVGGMDEQVAYTALAISSASALLGIILARFISGMSVRILPWIAAFAWGTGGALYLSGMGNGMVDTAIAQHIQNEDSVSFITSATTGPIVEEICKGIGIVILIVAARRILTRPTDGALIGVLTGLGFAWGEDISYYARAAYEGNDVLVDTVIMRGFLGVFAHALFSAILGYAVAWVLTRPTSLAKGALIVCAGYVGAVLVHAQANALGFVIPEDTWMLIYGIVEVPILLCAAGLLTWRARLERDTVPAKLEA